MTEANSLQIVSHHKKALFKKWLLQRDVQTMGWILLVAFFAYGLFYAPTLAADDWSQGVEALINGRATWFDPTNRRPLLYAPFLLQHTIFGFHFSAHYAILWLLNVAIAALLFKTLCQIKEINRFFFPEISTLLFLIFPTVYTHMWLTMLHGYLAMFFTLAFAYLLLQYVGQKNKHGLPLALLALLISYGLYDGQIGVVLAWVLVLLLIFRHTGRRERWIAAVSTLLLTLSFGFWRFWGLQLLGFSDKYLSWISISSKTLLSNLILGYKINLVWGWTAALQQRIPLPDSLTAIAFLGGIILFSWAIASLIMRQISRRSSSNGRGPRIFQAKKSVIKPYAVSLTVGLGLIGAGYFPVIVAFQPNLGGLGSRYNLFASIGGAITVASFLLIASLYWASNRRQTTALFVAAAFPLLLLGVAKQMTVQHETRTAWEEQKDIWSQLFVQAPDFKEDTMVLFILSGYEDRFGYQNSSRTPLRYSWEASSALRLLYNRPDLAADVIFPDAQGFIEPQLLQQGVLTVDSGKITPYARVVAFEYAAERQELQQIFQVPGDLLAEQGTPQQFCRDCLVDRHVPDHNYRHFVKD